MSTLLSELGYELRIACMRLTRRVRFGTEALPPHFFSALSRLESGERTAADLAAHERVSAPTMSRLVAELAERGLVSKHPSETDKRCVQLRITDAGHSALAEGRRERDEWMTERLRECSAEERETLRAATDIINRLCGMAS